MKLSFLLSVLWLIPFSQGAMAQSSDVACEKHSSDSNKLKCYRAENTALKDKIKTLKTGNATKKSLINKTNEALRKEQLIDSFGSDTIPENNRKTDKSKRNNKIDQIEFKVKDIYPSNRGGLIIVLENGQTWRQLNSDNTKLALPRDRSGLTAVIKKSFMGGYRMTISKTGHTIKVSRLR